MPFQSQEIRLLLPSNRPQQSGTRLKFELAPEVGAKARNFGSYPGLMPIKSIPNTTHVHDPNHPLSRSPVCFFPSSASVSPLTCSKAMASDQDKGWNHRYYDSYRPVTKGEASSENRSPTITAESEAFRYHSNKHWHRAKSSSNSTPKGDASSTLKASRGQSQDYSSPAASVPDETPPTTGHHLQQLTRMASQGRKGTSIPDAALSRRSSRAVDAEEETHESEAQSRGFYPSSRSRTSNAVHVGRYELKRRQGDEETERSPKRSRGEEDDRDRPANRPRNAEEDEPVRLHCKNFMCMGEHSYQDCDKPMICWGCRSTKYVLSE